MGAVVNGVKDLGNSIASAGAGVGKGAQCPLKMVKKADVMDTLERNGANSLEYGSQTSPVVTELHGIAQGDL